MSYGYTPGDCKKLYELVDSFEFFGEEEKNHFKDLMYIRLLDVLKNHLKEKVLDSSIIDLILKNFLNSAYNRGSYLKITDFLFNQSLEEAPLKLHDKELGLYARWRLIIGK